MRTEREEERGAEVWKGMSMNVNKVHIDTKLEAVVALEIVIIEKRSEYI